MSQPEMDVKAAVADGQPTEVLAATKRNVRVLLAEARRFQGEPATPANIHGQMSCILAALDLLVERVYEQDSEEATWPRTSGSSPSTRRRASGTA